MNLPSEAKAVVAGDATAGDANNNVHNQHYGDEFSWSGMLNVSVRNAPGADEGEILYDDIHSKISQGNVVSSELSFIADINSVDEWRKPKYGSNHRYQATFAARIIIK